MHSTLQILPLYLLDSATALFVSFVPFRVYQRARIKSRTRKKVQELRVLTLPPKSFQDTMLLKPPITSIQIGLICTSAMTPVEVSTFIYILMSSFVITIITIPLSSNESGNKYPQAKLTYLKVPVFINCMLFLSSFMKFEKKKQ